METLEMPKKSKFQTKMKAGKDEEMTLGIMDGKEISM